MEQLPERPQEGRALMRSARMERASLDKENRTVPISVSSEEPVLSYVRGKNGYELAYEILDHSPGAIDLSRFEGPNGGPMLFNHNRSILIGRFKPESIGTDRKLRGTTRFGNSAFAEECFRDVQDDILTDTSIYYDYEPEDLKPEGMAPDGYPIYRAMKWRLYEASMVPVPADSSVGVGRSNSHPTNPSARQAGNPQENPMGDNPTPAPAAPATGQDGGSFNVTELRSRTLQEALQVRTAAEKLGMAKEFDELAFSGLSMTEVQTKLFERAAARPITSAPPISDQIGMTEKEKARFSLGKAILATYTGDFKEAGFEREVSAALAQRMGKTLQAHSILIPKDFQVPASVRAQMVHEFSEMGRRSARAALSVNAGTGLNPQAANVFTDYAGFIDLLRPASVLLDMGVDMVTGLQGNYAFVRQTVGATAYVLGEGATASDSDSQWELVEAKPHAVKAVLRYTKQQLAQSIFQLEAEATKDILRAHGQLVDSEGISGSDLSESLLTATGVGLVAFGSGTGGDATWPNVVALKTKVLKANAGALGPMAYLTDADVLGWMEGHTKFTNTGFPIYDAGKVGMFPAQYSNQVPLATTYHQMVFGAFNQAAFFEWGAMELQVNPYSEDTSGIIRIVTHDFQDFRVKQPKAFSKAVDVTVS